MKAKKKIAFRTAFSISEYIKLCVFVLLFSLFSGSVSAQKENCLEDVKRVYQRWIEEVQAKSTSPTYLNYAMDLVTNLGTEKKRNTSNVEVISVKGKSIFLTKDIEIYQDEKNTVSIMPMKKAIYINRYIGDETKQNKVDHFSFLKDTLFTMLEVVNCEKLTINNKEYKQVILKATSTATKIFAIKAITFLIDEKLNQVKEASVRYVKGFQVQSMKIKVLKQNLNYKTDKLSKSALANVMNSSGKLLSKYSGYQLIDTRK